MYNLLCFASEIKALMSQPEAESCSAPCQTSEMENMGPQGRRGSMRQDL